MSTKRRDYRSADAAAYRKLYKTARWRALRRSQLNKQPLCQRCARRGQTTAATVVNHKQPHKGSEALFYSAENLESTCKPCHDGPIQRQERRGFSGEIGEDGWPVDPNHPINR